MFWLRWLIALLIVLSFACGTTYRKARPDLPASEREAVELSALHDDFEQALEDRRFDEAEDMLEELEDGMENASRALVMHKSYPVLSAQVVRAPKRLASARRTANVAEVIEQTQTQLAQLRELRASFEQSGGSEDALDRFDELTDALEDVLEDHEATAKDPRYRDLHAEARVALDEALQQRRIYSWQLEVSDELNDVLKEAPELPESPEDFAAAGDAAARRAEALKRCAEQGETLAYADGASVDVSVSTVLATAPLDDVRALCAAEAETAATLAEGYRWRARVQGVYDGISAALRDIEASKTKAESLSAHQAAVDAMLACPDALDPARPGYDPAVTFTGHMGEKGAERLVEACVTVIGNLEDRLPRLRWQAELESQGERYATAVDRFAGAREMEDPSDRAEAFAEILIELETCQSRAGALAVGEEEAWSGANLKRSNRRAAAKLEKRCRLLQPKVRKALEEARTTEE